MDNGATKPTVVLYPAGAVGHVHPMMQLAELFLEDGYDVAVVLIEPPAVKATGSHASVFESIVGAASTNPSISFHVLPPLPPPADVAGSAKRHPWVLTLESMRQYDAKLETFLRSVPRERLHALVVDMFCVHAIDVASKLDVPVYTFFASGAGVLAVLAELPDILAGRRTGLKELGDTPVEFLGMPAPMPASHLIRELLEHPDEDETCRTMMDVWRRNTDTHGVLVNTFEVLESRAVQAFRDPMSGLGKVWPQVYCVGPLVDKVSTSRRLVVDSRQECLDWLDAQPDRSVVFLCWGSYGLLSEDQLKELAAGLEKSGQRFLWVVRTPPPAAGTEDDDPKRYLEEEQRPEPDLDVLLPEGFLERTKDRGLVLKPWLPQVDVLNHPAVGAFVTHCGWNSTLESIKAGVPMLCWPLGAEQKMNKVLMTGDMGVAVEMAGYDTGFIKAEEVEAKVRLVMESDKGEELRKRAAKLQKEAEKAMEDGGSSRAAFLRFLMDVKDLAN